MESLALLAGYEWSQLYFQGTIVFIVAVYLVETYLDLRQYRKLQEKTKPAPLTFISDDEFQKARHYSSDKMRFHFVSALYSQIELLCILYFNFLPRVWSYAGDLCASINWSNDKTQALAFVFLYGLFSLITGLPFGLYSTFVIEERHGFNKQTLKLFLTDKVKGVIIGFFIGGPILLLILRVIEWGGEHFYIYVAAAIMAVQFILITIYPTFIQPCFNKVTPLRPGPLRSAIEELANSVQFPLTKLFVIDGSKRSSHSNAYFYGFWKNKRIVLYDTLIGKNEAMTEEDFNNNQKNKEGEQGVKKSKPAANKDAQEDGHEFCNLQEVVAVLGHELGHWKENHVLKLMVIGQVQILVQMYLFGLFLNDTELYTAFGFQEKPTLIGLVLFGFIMSPVDHVLSFLMNMLSRYHEFQADRFAVRLGHAAALAKGLIKLQKSNKSNMNPDSFYCAYHYSHPPLLERLNAIKEYSKKKN